MAFTTLTAQAVPFQSDGTPLEAVFDAASVSDGDEFAHSGNPLILHVKVTSAGGSRTITVVGAVASNQHQLNDVDIVVPDNEDRLFGLEPNQFKNSAGEIQLTYSDSGDSITVAVYELTG